MNVGLVDAEDLSCVKTLSICLTSMQMMISMNITIRKLDESVFRRFKAKAVEEGMRLGEAMAQAMEMWLRQKSVRRRASLIEIEPFDWGKGTEKTSVEIDQILYREEQ